MQSKNHNSEELINWRSSESIQIPHIQHSGLELLTQLRASVLFMSWLGDNKDAFISVLVLHAYSKWQANSSLGFQRQTE